MHQRQRGRERGSQFGDGHVVQKQVALIAHRAAREENFIRLYVLELTGQILTGEQPGDGDCAAEKVVQDGAPEGLDDESLYGGF